MSQTCDYLIIGAGILGLSTARALLKREPGCSILVIEKEAAPAMHASGRSSGVLHAGFYYTADTLKAKFSIAGNRALREYCSERGLPINTNGKLVVAANAREAEQLGELERRGKLNGSDVSLVTAAEAEQIEPNVRTFERALWSPQTATVDPASICNALQKDLQTLGVRFEFNTPYLGRAGSTGCRTGAGVVDAGVVINCAGLYADKIAQDFGFGSDFTIVPFKGLYLKYTKNKTDLRTNIYPVPNLKQTFLGVHFTITVDGTIKIGPTAIPALWRENYHGLSGFNLSEFAGIAACEAKLFFTNAFGFRDLALEEMRKYSKRYLIELAAQLVKHIDRDGFTEYSRPGMRAQLVRKKTLEIVMDFVIEGDDRSVHLLNGISPGFTCSFPFAEHVVANHVRR